MVDARKTHQRIPPNPREAAYLAVLASIKNEKHVTDSLTEWQNKSQPAVGDYHLAREIAYGSVRMALALDFMASQLTENHKLNVKPKERALIRTAVYQSCFMDRIPIYAIVNETVSLAKKYCHPTFIKFLNAILRKLSEIKPDLPLGDSVSDLSIRYSYPNFFVAELIHDYGLEKAKDILECGNQPSQTLFKIRSNANLAQLTGIQIVENTHGKYGILKNPGLLNQIASSSDYYIQNVTPGILIQNLCQQTTKQPANILDLCASPGGKLIAVHDYFPQAELTANDVSENKLITLKENCHKYSLEASLSISKGELYSSSQPFDVVILDVPCSNSGVLNKRPDARWRISETCIHELEKLQFTLLENASNLIAKDGEIWYMTCSILKRENEVLVEKAAQQLNLKIKSLQTILPNNSGWDGGFACSLIL